MRFDLRWVDGVFRGSSSESVRIGMEKARVTIGVATSRHSRSVYRKKILDIHSRLQCVGRFCWMLALGIRSAILLTVLKQLGNRSQVKKMARPQEKRSSHGPACLMNDWIWIDGSRNL